MRSKIIVIVATLILALSVGTSPAIAKKSVDTASPGFSMAATAVSDTPATNSFSWGITASGWDIKENKKK